MNSTSFYGQQKRSQKFATFLESVEKAARYDRDGFFQYEIYHSQEQAFKKQLTSFVPLSIFTFQYDQSNPGKRKFIVTCADQFFERYIQNPNKHHYELIKENSPCHLYFDLEFNKSFNLNKNGDEMVDNLKKIVEIYLSFKYNVSVESVIDLESSTDHKFSRHLVIKCKNAVFSSNQDAGSMVNTLIKELEILSTTQEPSTDFQKRLVYSMNLSSVSSLFVNTEKGKATFIDTSVYSKNRQFRLVLSSKLGKNTKLNFIEPKEEISFQEFKSTLVSNVTYSPKIKILNATHYTSRTVSKPMESTIKSQSSPFNLLDQFLLSRLPGAKIRSVVYFNDSKTLIYNIDGNRFCGNINRHHKSNGVYYVAELSKGIISQRCHDPDCRHYKSAPIEFPSSLWTITQGELSEVDDDLFKEIPDEALLSLAD